MNCLFLSPDGRVLGAVFQSSEQGCTDYLVNSAPQGTETMLVLSTPGDPGGSSSEALPSPEDAAAAWGIGFVMVVGCYVLARSVGAVVNFINRD